MSRRLPSAGRHAASRTRRAASLRQNVAAAACGTVAWALLGLGILASAPTLSHAMSAEDLFQRASPSIWVISTLDPQGKPLSTGTGVVIERGRLVTNCHVLAKAGAIMVKHENVTFQAQLEYPDTERDLCSVKVDNFTAPAVTTASVATLRVGQKIYTIGTPRLLEQTMSDGLVSSLRRNSSGAIEYIQISAPISPGSSGGGLFDEQGRLVGITTSGITGTAQNLNFARPADWIFDLPERGRLALAAYNRPSSTPPVVQQGSARPDVPGSPRLHLEMPMLLGRTWAYRHPRDPATFGTVELTFSAGRIFARNAKSTAWGSWEVRDDTMCATFNVPGWSRICYYTVKDGEDVQLVNAASGERIKLNVR
ncbi:S1C family serine protease [Variovorax sp. RB3P1]|uniref:S1C family serine protease n=1 Tax=Variovorax sp. RB3P1 TaxID=3443732 RepID=UPI003F49B139